MGLFPGQPSERHLFYPQPGSDNTVSPVWLEAGPNWTIEAIHAHNVRQIDGFYPPVDVSIWGTSFLVPNGSVRRQRKSAFVFGAFFFDYYLKDGTGGEVLLLDGELEFPGIENYELNNAIDGARVKLTYNTVNALVGLEILKKVDGFIVKNGEQAQRTIDLLHKEESKNKVLGVDVGGVGRSIQGIFDTAENVVGIVLFGVIVFVAIQAFQKSGVSKVVK